MEPHLKKMNSIWKINKKYKQLKKKKKKRRLRISKVSLTFAIVHGFSSNLAHFLKFGSGEVWAYEKWVLSSRTKLSPKKKSRWLSQLVDRPNCSVLSHSYTYHNAGQCSSNNQMGPYGNTPSNSQCIPYSFFTFQEVRCLVSPINLESVVKFVIKQSTYRCQHTHRGRKGGMTSFWGLLYIYFLMELWRL